MSFGGTGLRDWWIQRVSAVVLAAYTVWILGYLITHQPFDFDAWRVLFQNSLVIGFTLAALISLVLHAWLGVWTIATDYIKPLCIRVPFLLGVIAALASYLFWGVMILWGIN